MSVSDLRRRVQNLYRRVLISLLGVWIKETLSIVDFEPLLDPPLNVNRGRLFILDFHNIHDVLFYIRKHLPFFG